VNVAQGCIQVAKLDHRLLINQSDKSTYLIIIVKGRVSIHSICGLIDETYRFHSTLVENYFQEFLNSHF
jgi:hypothetical protein